MTVAEREFRCRVCGRVDAYAIPTWSLVRPIHCYEAMRPGGVRCAEAVEVRIDLIEDQRQPWRLGVGDALRRERILSNHPDWCELRQVWRRGAGRLHGSEFIGMIGEVSGLWEYDLGAGVPSQIRTGRSRNDIAAVAAMLRSLG